MGDKKHDKKKGGKGGFGGKLLAVVALLAIGIGALYYFQPELVEQQLHRLRELTGL
ncbi:MAG: hypothetical protein IPM29_02160 [Planctomycetes bacterium]|nr:hypothetical protein [Planctomycetota bacterium]